MTSKIDDILDSTQLPNLRIERDYATDEIIFWNLNNHKSARISCFQLENSKLPLTMISDIIDKIMPWDHTMKISSGGSGGIQHIVSSGGSGGVGAGAMNQSFGTYRMPHDLDDPHANLKDKLFSDGERLQIMEVKKTIRTHMNRHMPMRNFDMSHVIVAGGCFASMLNGEVVKDFDVFLLESETNRAALASIETIENGLNPNVIKVSGSEYMNNDKIEKVVTFGSNAIQYISTKYKNRLELIEHFDFKHCCVSYDYKVDRLFITREVFDLIKSKTLEPNTDKPPAYWRYEKFWQRGWKSEIAIVTD